MATVYLEPGGWLRTLWEVQWFAGLIPLVFLAGWLVASAREGKWARSKIVLWAVPLVIWATPFVVAQGLSMWALQQRPAAMVVSAEGIWCAPWRETVRWENVRTLGSFDEKMRSGWKSLGVTLELARAERGGLDLRPAAYESRALTWGVRLARGKLFTKSETAIPCALHGTTVEASELTRLVQEIHFKLGPRVGAQYRARNKCWVAQCLDGKSLDWRCVANLPSDSGECPAGL
ncbi:MAG: hypothetical protein J0L64_21870 [Acidobacteria bacterium]|nr:hypothetical protein [Acidobacteriota bacterium]